MRAGETQLLRRQRASKAGSTVGTGQFSRSRSAPKPRNAADPSRQHDLATRRAVLGGQARAGQAEQRGQRAPGGPGPGELGCKRRSRIPSWCTRPSWWPRSRRPPWSAGSAPPRRRQALPARSRRRRAGSDAARSGGRVGGRAGTGGGSTPNGTPRPAPRSGRAARRRSRRTAARTGPAARGAGRTGPAPPALGRVQVVDRGQLGDDGPVGERDARGQLLRDGVVAAAARPAGCSTSAPTCSPRAGR